MSDEQSNQPRKVKDLKARLGRTIAPSTPGAVMPPGINLPPPVAGLPVPPPSTGAEPATPAAAGGVPIPPGIPAPALPPPAAGLGTGLGSPLPGPKAVVEPPWVKQQREDEERRRVEDEKRKKRAAADPFATAQAPAGPQAVRIVIDDSAIDAAETGKRGKNLATVGVVVIVALIAMLIGKSIGGTMAQRDQHNSGVDSAETLHRTVQRGDAALQIVKTNITSMIEAAQAGAGKTPHVDYAALEAALAVENPFTAEHFSSTNYVLFDRPAIDAMLTYYDSTRELFDRLQRLARSYNIRNPVGRAQVDASFQAFDNFAKYPAGCVPTLIGPEGQQRWMCNMVFADVEHAAADGVPTRPRPTATPTTREVYNGSQALGAATSDKLLILINFAASADVMGSTLHLHDRFVREIGEIKGILDTAMQARADFRNEMDRIRHLERQRTF